MVSVDHRPRSRTRWLFGSLSSLLGRWLVQPRRALPSEVPHLFAQLWRCFHCWFEWFHRAQQKHPLPASAIHRLQRSSPLRRRLMGLHLVFAVLLRLHHSEVRSLRLASQQERHPADRMLLMTQASLQLRPRHQRWHSFQRYLRHVQGVPPEFAFCLSPRSWRRCQIEVHHPCRQLKTHAH